jgi:hypothetical protein
MTMTAPYQPHSATSREAARKIEPRQGSLRAIVLAFIRERGPAGATDEEIQAELRLNPSTQRPRRIELCEVGLVIDSGRQRPTASRRRAAVWIDARLMDQQQPLPL